MWPLYAPWGPCLLEGWGRRAVTRTCAWDWGIYTCAPEAPHGVVLAGVGMRRARRPETASGVQYSGKYPWRGIWSFYIHTWPAGSLWGYPQKTTGYNDFLNHLLAWSIISKYLCRWALKVSGQAAPDHLCPLPVSPPARLHCPVSSHCPSAAWSSAHSPNSRPDSPSPSALTFPWTEF